MESKLKSGTRAEWRRNKEAATLGLMKIRSHLSAQGGYSRTLRSVSRI